MAAMEFKLANLKKVQANIKRVPTAAAEALARQLKIEVDDLVGAIKRAMDIAYADSDDHGHQKLRDSVHAYKNPDRVISYRILADAKDEHGKFIGSNVEAGHRTVDGKHVTARPAMYPTYRAHKKGMQRRMSAAARKAIRQEWSS
jgi:hypothetical protein